ncbi:MAG: immunity 22 family protein [Lachnospiraceae bacterium]|nr:immunity 22 family protein [Lachnospiraceae bacterium]
MIKNNKVSLWLGQFNTSEEFYAYADGKYDEDGNYIESEFQKEFGILQYDMDSIEKDWIFDKCDSLRDLLLGFSYDDEIISNFSNGCIIKDLHKYNSILLLYNFEYDNHNKSNDDKMDFIGCVDVNIL